MKCTIEKYASILDAGRPVSGRHRMDIGHRAKQFAPFSALKGLEESVREKEIIYVEKSLLPDDRRSELDWIIRTGENTQNYEVTYYKGKDEDADKGRYCRTYGRIRSGERQGYIYVGETELKNTDIKDIVEIANM